ncbi:MAG: HPP family protein [Clostridiaceae bacterium]|jgi:hypothetical protein|nr:HPP family protein [Clostridiaceae bacterium]
MNVKALKLVKYERYLLALIMTFIMFVSAGLTGQKEIIFPEVLAIMTGAWLDSIQPWNVNKRRIFILTCLTAFIGVAIVKYIHIALFWQVFVAFVSCGVLLVLLKTNFIPIISACILPVYLQTTTWVYSVAVSIMTLVIITVQWLMEKYKLRSINHYNPEFDIKKNILLWVKLFLIFGIIAIIPIESKNIFFLAPPLVVTFVSFANPKSPVRKKILPIYGVLVFAAIVGTGMRVLLNMDLNVPLAICAVISCVAMFFVFDYTRIFFPPSGAVVILPFLLRYDDLKWFPLEVAIGAAVVISVSMIMFREKRLKRDLL